MMRRPVRVVVCLAVCACGGESRSVPQPTYGALGGEVARIGGEPLGGDLVGESARARGVTAAVALGDLVDDALLAQGARAQGLEAAADVHWAETVLLGRTFSRRAWDDARSRGAPTDDELAEVTVVHAVVLRSRSLPEARALFTAKAIADAVATARTSDEFEARAKAVSTEVRTTIEELPAFDVAGHLENGQQLDPDFTIAAFALRSPGETSPVIESPFGWHVIRLISRVVPPPAELEKRRPELADAVLAGRARTALSVVLRSRREHTRVEVVEGADDLLAQVAMTR
jgi:hypothetical protein